MKWYLLVNRISPMIILKPSTAFDEKKVAYSEVKNKSYLGGHGVASKSAK